MPIVLTGLDRVREARAVAQPDWIQYRSIIATYSYAIEHHR